MITYADYTNGNPNIEYGTWNNKHLILGFLVEKGDYETRYALRQDGTIFESETALVGNVWFNKKGVSWVRCAMIPQDAQFIGQYVDDIREFTNP